MPPTAERPGAGGEGVSVPAKEEGYSDPLDYFSGSMGIVSLNLILPYLGHKGMQVFLDQGFASVSLLLVACLGAS